MPVTSMYAVKRQEITDMRAAGMNCKQIVDELIRQGIPAKHNSLWAYCQRLDNPRFTPAPHCRECEHRLVVESAENRGGHKYICLPEKKEIGRDCITSPWWCRKREKNENRIT